MACLCSACFASSDDLARDFHSQISSDAYGPAQVLPNLGRVNVDRPDEAHSGLFDQQPDDLRTYRTDTVLDNANVFRHGVVYNPLTLPSPVRLSSRRSLRGRGNEGEKHITLTYGSAGGGDPAPFLLLFFAGRVTRNKSSDYTGAIRN